MHLCGRQPHNARLGVTFSNRIDVAKIRATLARLAERPCFAKSFIPTPAGTVYLDFSTVGMSDNLCHMPSAAEPGLAIIAPANQSDTIDALLNRVRASPLLARPDRRLAPDAGPARPVTIAV